MFVDESPDRIRVDPSMLTQRPADGLADEELGVGGSMLGVAEEPLGVGGFLEPELMEDGGAGQPDVVVVDPFVHRGDERRVGTNERAHDPRSKSVDGVPPTLGRDEAGQIVEVFGVERAGVLAQQIGADVLELPFGLGPAGAGEGHEFVTSGVGKAGDGCSGGGPTGRSLHPEERELVFHVRGHRFGISGHGNRLEFGAKLIEVNCKITLHRVVAMGRFIFLLCLALAVTACTSSNDDDVTVDDSTTVADQATDSVTETDATTGDGDVDSAEVDADEGGGEAVAIETTATGQLAAALDLTLGWFNGNDVNDLTYVQVFDEAFQEAVPFEQFNPVLDQLRPNGPWIITEELFVDTTTAQVRIQGATAADVWDLLIVINGPEQLKINTLFVGPPQNFEPPASVDAAIERLEAMGTLRLGVHEITGGECNLIEGRNTEEQMPLGSIFKVYVLAAVVDAVADGSISWDDPVEIRDELDSVPSGVTQDEPAGSSLTVQVLAERMIEISDNTATDHLIDLVGRDGVEAAMVDAGHSDPDRNRPFLSTREFTILKFGVGDETRAAWVASDSDERQSILEEAITPASLPTVDAIVSVIDPVEVEAIEWFASPADLCRVFGQLAGDETARSILARNPGMPDAAARWGTILYKGGSEPGVFAMAWLVEGSEGTFVVSGSVSNESALIDELDAPNLFGYLRDTATVSGR